MKSKIKKSLGIIALTTGLIGMTLPTSTFAWHRHHHWHHGRGAIFAASMVGLAVGAIAANNARYYNTNYIPAESCTYRSYWVPGHWHTSYYGNTYWRHGHYVQRRTCY